MYAVPTETRETLPSLCGLSPYEGSGSTATQCGFGHWFFPPLRMNPVGDKAPPLTSAPLLSECAFPMKVEHPGCAFTRPRCLCPVEKKFASRGIYSVLAREWTTFSARSTCITCIQKNIPGRECSNKCKFCFLESLCQRLVWFFAGPVCPRGTPGWTYRCYLRLMSCQLAGTALQIYIIPRQKV